MPAEDKIRTFENIVRLRRAEREAPESRDIPIVRAWLEQELGEIVSQRLAARLLGISHTGLRRWITSGDVPVVYGRKGRMEVPVSSLLEVYEDVQAQRESGRHHVVEPGIAAARARARNIRPTEVPEDADEHRSAEIRSLSYHRAVARRMRRSMVDDARHRLWVWRANDRIDPRFAAEWEQVLASPLRDVRALITEDSVRGRDLRQNSPFAGALSEAERRAVSRRSEA
jgi:hypothetical protein